MEPFVILVALALALTLLLRVLDETVPLHVPTLVTRAAAVAIAAFLAWGLDYSAFAAFGQELRAEWMHPVATGLVLVAVGDAVRTIITAIGRRGGAPAEAPSIVDRA